jgi:hypothetical protein
MDVMSDVKAYGLAIGKGRMLWHTYLSLNDCCWTLVFCSFRNVMIWFYC